MTERQPNNAKGNEEVVRGKEVVRGNEVAVAWAKQIQEVVNAKNDQKAQLEAKRAQQIIDCVDDVWSKCKPLNDDNFCKICCEHVAKYVFDQVSSRDVGDKRPITFSLFPSFSTLRRNRDDWRSSSASKKPFESQKKHDVIYQDLSLFYCRVFDAIFDLAEPHLCLANSILYAFDILKKNRSKDAILLQYDSARALLHKLNTYIHSLITTLINTWNSTYGPSVMKLDQKQATIDSLCFDFYECNVYWRPVLDLNLQEHAQNEAQHAADLKRARDDVFQLQQQLQEAERRADSLVKRLKV
jgi:hypothetical protein